MNSQLKPILSRFSKLKSHYISSYRIAQIIENVSIILEPKFTPAKISAISNSLGLALIRFAEYSSKYPDFQSLISYLEMSLLAVARTLL